MRLPSILIDDHLLLNKPRALKPRNRRRHRCVARAIAGATLGEREFFFRVRVRAQFRGRAQGTLYRQVRGKKVFKIGTTWERLLGVLGATVSRATRSPRVVML